VVKRTFIIFKVTVYILVLGQNVSTIVKVVRICTFLSC
jgi:hypothetical protein